jgi:hypothetical protein
MTDTPAKNEKQDFVPGLREWEAEELKRIERRIRTKRAKVPVEASAPELRFIPTDRISRAATAILNEALKQGVIDPKDDERIDLSAVELHGVVDIVALARAALKKSAL